MIRSSAAQAHPAATNGAGPTPNASRKREGSETCRAAGEGSRSGVGSAPHKPRHHEWTRARQAAFLRELAALQSVSHAALSVGMSRQSAYKLRRRMAGQPFAEAWDMALDPIRLHEALAPVEGLCPVCRQPSPSVREFR